MIYHYVPWQDYASRQCSRTTCRCATTHYTSSSHTTKCSGFVETDSAHHEERLGGLFSYTINYTKGVIQSSAKKLVRDTKHFRRFDPISCRHKRHVAMQKLQGSVTQKMQIVITIVAANISVIINIITFHTMIA